METISKEDSALFRQAIQGMKALYSSQNSSLKKQNPSILKTPQENTHNQHYFEMSICDSEQLTPNDYIAFERNPLHTTQRRKIKQGRIDIQASIDLHGMTIDQAGNAISQLIQNTYSHNLRHVHIIHGKGSNARLKNQVYQWLKATPVILAIYSCQPKDGGTGAIYVLYSSPFKTPKIEHNEF